MEIADLTGALRAFNAIEDRRDTLRAAYDKSDAKLKDARDKIELYMLEELKRLGMTACEVPGEGVASIRVKRRFGGSDWGLIWAWVVENRCPEMLQKRLLDTAIQAHLESTGELPPGVSSEARQIIAVTKRPPK